MAGPLLSCFGAYTRINIGRGLFWYTNTHMRGVGSASCALWRCFQSLALITLTAKCNAQLFFGVLHSVGTIVLAHVHSFVAQLLYLRR